MSVYHQMGHDSENLLRAAHLGEYAGAILSPVNYEEPRIASQVSTIGDRPDFTIWFDPQLYVPTSERGKLRTWEYFPTDVDTADLASDAWWERLVAQLVACCARLGAPAICSPAVLSREYSNDYFRTVVFAGNRLARELAGSGIRPIQTAVVGMNDLAVPNRGLAIASILTASSSDEVYLVLIGAVEPRRELVDVDEIKGAMALIAELRNAGMKVTVGFTSSDMLLWKFAGAENCATGKFFNLRRFTRSRFDNPTAGGGQLPYWFEESLLAFLREPDLIRVRAAGLLSDASNRNPFAQDILAQFDSQPGRAWLATSWRQYLWWFADAEQRVRDGGPSYVPAMLQSAEEMWMRIENTILMDERANNGTWLRSWRKACLEFGTP